MVYFPLSTITVNDFYRGLAFNLGLEATFRKVDLFKQTSKPETHNALQDAASDLRGDQGLAGTSDESGWGYIPCLGRYGHRSYGTVSRGWPRLLTNLATTSLIYGCQKRLKYIDEEAVRQAAAELGM
ncbi:MAG: hypothetical protein GXX09_06960 [Syntrophomonadaceae bacterium]|nr:hypothetical protein [Syntrophomonadaceae bacterium]